MAWQHLDKDGLPMALDPSVQVLPWARVRRTSNSAAMSATTWNAITWQVSDINVGGMWNSGVNPSRITISEPGKYLVTANVGLTTGLVVGDDKHLAIIKNGDNTNGMVARVRYVPAATDEPPEMLAMTTLDLQAGDYLETKCWPGSSSTTVAFFESLWTPQMSVVKIGPGILSQGINANHEPWQNVSTYGTNWSSSGETPQFRRDNLGVVWIRGSAVKSGTPASNDLIFTLPVGYRPTGYQRWANWGDTVPTATNLAMLRAEPDGSVRWFGGPTTAVLVQLATSFHTT